MVNTKMTKLSFDHLTHFTEKGVQLHRIGRGVRWLPRSKLQERPTDEQLQAMKDSGKPGHFTIPLWLLKDDLRMKDPEPKKSEVDNLWAVLHRHKHGVDVEVK